MRGRSIIGDIRGLGRGLGILRSWFGRGRRVLGEFLATGVSDVRGRNLADFEFCSCGRFDCDGNAVKGNATGWLVFCEYWPPGNVEGEYSQEVNKEIVKCVANGGGEAGKVAQELCAKINGAERSGRALRAWSWEAVLVAGAWILVRAAL